jgi:type I restriction enzyme M protein
MAITSKELGQLLWKIANKQRGTMSASDYKDYILGFVFYKDISEQMENMANKVLENDNIKYIKLNEKEHKEYLNIIKEESLKQLGYFIPPYALYSELLKSDEDIYTEKEPFILEKLEKALKNIEKSTLGQTSEEDFMNLFERLDLKNSNLGDTVEDKNRLVYQTMIEFKDIELSGSDGDLLGDAYEYLISKFAASGGTNKAGEYYTPQPVSELLVQLLTSSTTKKVKKIYDPTCGSGSLLLRFKRTLGYTPNFYGQELNGTTYNLARMNMIMHNVSFNKFDIKRGDTLETPKHINEKFDIIGANPPYSAHWSANELFLQDERFSQYTKLAPKTKADFAFLQHMVYQLDDNGTMGVVLPHGVLFRGGAEGVIRKYLIEDKNYIDTIIGLPDNMFFGTSIATVIIIIKKCRKDDDNILFVDASQEFIEIGNKNAINNTHIEKILNTYKERKTIDKYSYSATLKEVEGNDYNLNISRYVNIIEKEEIIDLSDITTKLNNLDKEINNNNLVIESFCKELDIISPIKIIKGDNENG